MKLTSRDIEVIEYLKKFKIAKTSTIHELFYKPSSLQVTQRRLKKMMDNSNLKLKREREHFTYQYMYYYNKKPKQISHDLLLTSLHSELNKRVEIIDFRKEFSIGNLRSDGFVAYRYNNNNYISFIEIQISNVSADIDKYTNLYSSQQYKEYFPTFPSVIVVSNRKVKVSNDFKIIHLKEDLSDIERSL